MMTSNKTKRDNYYCYGIGNCTKSYRC